MRNLLPPIRHKTQGHQRALRTWMCILCHHEHNKKTKFCKACGGKKLLYFMSKVEKNYYYELWRRKELGLITNLRTSVPFKIEYEGQLITKYVADFVYDDLVTKQTIVVDVKGHIKNVDPVFKLKRKLVKAFHGVDIQSMYGGT